MSIDFPNKLKKTVTDVAPLLTQLIHLRSSLRHLVSVRLAMLLGMVLMLTAFTTTSSVYAASDAGAARTEQINLDTRSPSISTKSGVQITRIGSSTSLDIGIFWALFSLGTTGLLTKLRVWSTNRHIKELLDKLRAYSQNTLNAIQNKLDPGGTAKENGQNPLLGTLKAASAQIADKSWQYWRSWMDKQFPDKATTDTNREHPSLAQILQDGKLLTLQLWQWSHSQLNNQFPQSDAAATAQPKSGPVTSRPTSSPLIPTPIDKDILPQGSHFLRESKAPDIQDIWQKTATPTNSVSTPTTDPTSIKMSHDTTKTTGQQAPQQTATTTASAHASDSKRVAAKQSSYKAQDLPQEIISPNDNPPAIEMNTTAPAISDNEGTPAIAAGAPTLEAVPRAEAPLGSVGMVNNQAEPPISTAASRDNLDKRGEDIAPQLTDDTNVVTIRKDQPQGAAEDAAVKTSYMAKDAGAARSQSSEILAIKSTASAADDDKTLSVTTPTEVEVPTLTGVPFIELTKTVQDANLDATNSTSQESETAATASSSLPADTRTADSTLAATKETSKLIGVTAASLTPDYPKADQTVKSTSPIPEKVVAKLDQEERETAMSSTQATHARTGQQDVSKLSTTEAAQTTHGATGKPVVESRYAQAAAERMDSPASATTTAGVARKAVPLIVNAASDEAEPSGGVFKKILPWAAVLAALLILPWWFFGREAKTPENATAKVTTTAPSPESTPAIAGDQAGPESAITPPETTPVEPSNTSPTVGTRQSASSTGTVKFIMLPGGKRVDVVGGSLQEKLYDQLNSPTADLSKALKLEGLNFVTGSAKLRPESASIVQQLGQVLQAYPAVTIRIEGHTDNRGNPQQNMKLSAARAQALKTSLTRGGIAPNRIETRGFGQNVPIASNDTEAGRKENRRLQVLITKK